MRNQDRETLPQPNQLCTLQHCILPYTHWYSATLHNLNTFKRYKSDQRFPIVLARARPRQQPPTARLSWIPAPPGAAAACRTEIAASTNLGCGRRVSTSNKLPGDGEAAWELYFENFCCTPTWSVNVENSVF